MRLTEVAIDRRSHSRRGCCADDRQCRPLVRSHTLAGIPSPNTACTRRDVLPSCRTLARGERIPQPRPAMPYEHLSRRLSSAPAGIAIGGLIAMLGGCASTSADARTTSTETRDKIPITTASADAKTLYLEGRALVDRLRPQDGRALFEQAIAKDPTFAMAHFNLATSAVTAQARAEHLSAAVAQSGTVSAGERLLILATQARANADPITALRYDQQLVAQYPRDERAHFALGLAYFAQEEYDKAIAEFEQAIQVDSGFSPGYNMIGYAYRPVGKYAEAEAAFTKYIQLIPDDPNPYDSYAELLMKTGRFDESIAQYEKALSIDPHFSASRVGIAADHMFKGEYVQAIGTAQRLYDAARDDGDRRLALLSQAVTNVDAGKTEQALQALTAEYALDARIADTAAMAADDVALGDVLLDAGKPNAARASYAQALDLITTSSQSADVKDDATLANRYNLARVALATNDRATAEADAAAYASGARARHNALRIRQAHELAGLIALDSQNPALAVTELLQADQQDPYVLYALARAFEGTGQESEANAMALAAANAHTLPTLSYAFVRMKAKKMTE
jgi:tetratricopeptide (TPR) repeat protein